MDKPVYNRTIRRGDAVRIIGYQWPGSMILGIPRSDGGETLCFNQMNGVHSKDGVESEFDLMPQLEPKKYPLKLRCRNRARILGAIIAIGGRTEVVIAVPDAEGAEVVAYVQLSGLRHDGSTDPHDVLNMPSMRPDGTFEDVPPEPSLVQVQASDVILILDALDCLAKQLGSDFSRALGKYGDGITDASIRLDSVISR